MKRLIKKSLKMYDNINGIDLRYTMDGGICSMCGEKIFTDDGAYYAKKDGREAYICEDCANSIEKEDIEDLM